MNRCLQYVIHSFMVLFVITSCIAPQTVTIADVSSEEWDYPVTLSVYNNDTLSLRRLSIVLHYNNDFKCDSLPLNIRISLPDISQFSEQITLCPEFPYTPTSVSATENISYRSKSVFNQNGYYLFTIRPMYKICGIKAIGINIEKE